MPTYKNEKGAALIVVLLIITIIAIITPPVVSNILSSAEQFQRTEESMQRTNLTDMGLTYMEKAIMESEEIALNDTESWLANLDSFPADASVVEFFRSSLNKEFERLELKQGMDISITDQIQYRTVVTEIKIENGQDILVNYTITPTMNGDFHEDHQVKESKTIHLDIGVLDS